MPCLILLPLLLLLCSGVSTFVSEFVKRKVAEQNRKPGGKKKKGGAAAAAATAGAAGMATLAAAAGGVTMGGVGLVSATNVSSDAWSKIPKKPGKKGKKSGTKLDPSQLGFTSKLDVELLQGDDDE
jgi:Na+-transporting methylmalonyl-CoA/oxaloacetate decarboxylase gamma subunit